MKYALAERTERDRLDGIRTAYAAQVGHTCPLYWTPRSGPPHFDGPSDPALQEGIGCPICYPPDGRASRRTGDDRGSPTGIPVLRGYVMTVQIREFRARMATYLDRAARGEVVRVRRHGQEFALCAWPNEAVE